MARVEKIASHVFLVVMGVLAGLGLYHIFENPDSGYKEFQLKTHYTEHLEASIKVDSDDPWLCQSITFNTAVFLDWMENAMDLPYAQYIQSLRIMRGALEKIEEVNKSEAREGPNHILPRPLPEKRKHVL
jgi:hypothetical protein